MAVLRLKDKLQVHLDREVRVVFEKHPVREHVCALLQCIQCEALLVFEPQRRSLVCGECGYELSVEGAREIVAGSQEQLLRLRSSIDQLRGRRTWGSVRHWLARLLLGL
jgi:hypothetical protein